MSRLFGKLFLSFWLSLLISGVSIGTGVWLYRDNVPKASLHKIISAKRTEFLFSAVNAIAISGGKEALQLMLQKLDDNMPITLYIIDAKNADLLNRTIPKSIINEVERYILNKQPSPVIREVQLINGEKLIAFTLTNHEKFKPGFNSSFKPPFSPLPPIDAPPPRRLWWLPPAVGLLASLIFSALLAWYLARPIRHLRQAFESAARGNLNTRVQPLIGNRRDEIADLGIAYDKMANKLKKIMDSQRRLFHDVSHELRSPLARLQVAIDLAQQKKQDMNIFMQRVEREVIRIDYLVEEILILARLESDLPIERQENLNLTEIINDIIFDAEFEAKVDSCQIQYLNKEKMIFSANKELISRAIENVLRNAIKHSPCNSTIIIQSVYDQQKEHYRIDIIDQGNGVSPENLSTIFNPFFRNDNSGFGLGLAIAYRAIKIHDGHIKAVNMPDSGLKITIELPANHQ